MNVIMQLFLQFIIISNPPLPVLHETPQPHPYIYTHYLNLRPIINAK